MINMSIIDEEQKYLEYTLQCINNEIKKNENKINELENEGRKLSYEDRKRGSHLSVNSMLDFYDKILISLQKSLPKPYFGRIDFKENGYSTHKTYIGRSGISSDNNIIVVDWRAPISSLYYDSELGKVSYNSPSGLLSGELTLKRQINIENGELLDAQDTSLVTDDDLLKPYLNINADNRMKIIIASIQKEQNAIIRKPLNVNMIIQGVAGSGKTSVALHRIAYLIYNLNSNFNVSDQFLVLGPNDYFLNYISSILPDLDTTPIDQKTLLSFTNEYTRSNLSLSDDNSDYEYIQKFKSSLDYKNVLDQYMNQFLNEQLIHSAFEIDGETVFSIDEIKDILFIDKKYPSFKKAYLYFSNKLKNKSDELYDKLNEKYRKIYTKLPKDDPVRKEAVHKSMVLSRTLKEEGTKLLKKYFNDLEKKPLDIYKMFISDIDKFDTNLSEKQLLILQKETLLLLKRKKINFEDIPAIIHINYRYTGEKVKYKNIVIDEAQDYGMFHFEALKEISPEAKFSIYGDLAQSIYSYRSVDSWESVKKQIFNDNCEILKLNKSYRTTIEITENANIILEKLNLNKAQPVVRHGSEVEYHNESMNIDYKVKKIQEWIEKGHKTIAVICKTEQEAKKINKQLLENGINSKNITSKDNEYSGGVFVLTSFAAKGLEFDAVIINDASIDKYSISSDVDKHLLYVASTRALHDQVILYDNVLTDIYDTSKYEHKEENKVLIKK